MAFMVPISALAIGIGAFVFSKICLNNQSNDEEDKKRSSTIIKTDREARGKIFTPYGNTKLIQEIKHAQKIDPVHFFEVIDQKPEYLNSIVWLFTTQLEGGNRYQYTTLNTESYYMNLEENKRKALAFMGFQERVPIEASNLEKKPVKTSANAAAALGTDPSNLSVAQRAQLHQRAQIASAQPNMRSIKRRVHVRNRSAFDRMLGFFSKQEENEINFDLFHVYHPPENLTTFQIEYTRKKTARLWVVALSIENAVGNPIFKRYED
jgi:hypothetical protein